MSDPKQDPSAQKPAAKPAAPSSDAAKPLAQKIGFERLDLRVEEVEERISPRETNVFDK